MFFMKDLPRGQFVYTVIALPLLIVALIAAMIMRIEHISFGLAVLLATVFVPLAIADLHRVKAKDVSPTHRRIEIRSPAAPEALFAKLQDAKLDRLKLRDSDAQRRVLVLEAPMSGWSWGFHIPVFVRDAGIGSTVEIGIMPKMVQHVSTVEQWHEKAAAEIEKALAA